MVKRISVLCCSNEEIMHWTSSLILSELEYEQKFNALTNFHKNAANSAQLETPMQANSSSSLTSATKTNNRTQLVNEEDIAVNNLAQTKFCSCNALSGTSSVVKEQLKYCTCVSYKTNPLSLDPLGKFGVLLLSFLLRQRKVLAEGKSLQITLTSLKYVPSVTTLLQLSSPCEMLKYKIYPFLINYLIPVDRITAFATELKLTLLRLLPRRISFIKTYMHKMPPPPSAIGTVCIPCT